MELEGWKIDKSIIELLPKEQLDKAIDAVKRGYVGKCTQLDDSIEDLAKNFRTLKSDRQRNIFLKDYGKGYYTSGETIKPEDVALIDTLVNGYSGIYNHFNKVGAPWSIEARDVGRIAKEIESRDIYAMMARRQYIVQLVSFKIYLNGEDVLIETYIISDGTISMQDIVNFM